MGGERQSSPPREVITGLPDSMVVEPIPAASGQHQAGNAVDGETVSNTSSHTTQRLSLFSQINPTKPSVGESLPDGFARNYAGSLIKTNKKRIHVSEELVAAEERFLQDHLLVASFIGGRPS